MRAHPLRTLFLVLLVVLAVVTGRLATADKGGVYDPQEQR